jgi:hypothetical protein
MTYLRNSSAGIDYRPCTYGSSKLVFRGPKAVLEEPYLAFLGSTATFGKFVATPFPELVGQGLGIGAVNLGCINAGVDTFAGDEAVAGICRVARACVVQVMGAHRLSNPLYGVHPRRNDRVLAPTWRLRKLYPEVDFAEIHFTRHLIGTLAGDPGRFAGVRDVLKSSWVSRMSRLIATLGVPVVLLWLTDGAEGATGNGADDAGPLLVDRDMIEALTPAPVAVVRAETGRPEAGTDRGRVTLSPFEEAAARELPGPPDHRRIAEATSAVLRSLGKD